MDQWSNLFFLVSILLSLWSYQASSKIHRLFFLLIESLFLENPRSMIPIQLILVQTLNGGYNVIKELPLLRRNLLVYFAGNVQHWSSNPMILRSKQIMVEEYIWTLSCWSKLAYLSSHRTCDKDTLLLKFYFLRRHSILDEDWVFLLLAIPGVIFVRSNELWRNRFGIEINPISSSYTSINSPKKIICVRDINVFFRYSLGCLSLKQ